jgi:hypothetical protein
MNSHELVGLYKFGVQIDNIRVRLSGFIMGVVGALCQLFDYRSGNGRVRTWSIEESR